MGWQENGRVAEWTDEQDRQIVAGWDDGLKAKQIAARMGRSGPPLSHKARPFSAGTRSERRCQEPWPI